MRLEKQIDFFQPSTLAWKIPWTDISSSVGMGEEQSRRMVSGHSEQGSKAVLGTGVFVPGEMEVFRQEHGLVSLKTTLVVM